MKKIILICWAIMYSTPGNALELGLNAGICSDTAEWSVCEEGMMAHVFVRQDIELSNGWRLNAQWNHVSEPEKSDLQGINRGSGRFDLFTAGISYKFF